MDLLSLSTSPLSANSLSSLHSQGSLKFCSPVSKTPTVSLRPSKCSLRSRQLPKTPKALVGNGDPRFEVKESVLSIGSSAPEATAMRGGDVDPMALLLRQRIVFLGNDINDFIADGIISQLLLLDAQDPTRDIRLFINSSGGSVSAAMAIHDVVKLVRADVSTVAMGISASTASLILGSGTKGKRLAMPNTRIMIHQPLGGSSGQALDLEIQTNEIMKNKSIVIETISAFTGRSVEQVEEDIDRDFYMSPLEAVEYGIIDDVIDRDSIIPVMPVPENVRGTIYEQIREDASKFGKPEIPDDEIF